MKTMPLLCAFILFGILFVPVLGQSSDPDSSAPWWSPPDVEVTQPEQFRDGWNLRVPLRLDAGNAHLPAGSPVQVHLDLGREAIKAGWPGSGSRPTSFTMDPDSVTLVRYGHNWNNVADRTPVPATVHVDWLEPDQRDRYDRIQSNPFDPRSNPIVTLEWRLEDQPDMSACPDGSQPGLCRLQRAFYYVYFEIEENSKKDPFPQGPEKAEPLDGDYWIGSGTRLFGHHPGANSLVPTVLVLGTQDNTKVTVSHYPGSSEFPIKDNEGRMGNPSGPDHPFTLDEGEVREWVLGLNPTHFMVEADSPVIVLNHAGQGSGDFLPATTGGTKGNHFYVLPQGPSSVYLIAPDLTGDPNVAVRFETTNLNDPTGCAGEIFPAGGQSFCRLETIDGALGEIRVTNNRPVLVQYSPPTESDIPAGDRRTWSQPPTIHGGSVGSEFMVSTDPVGSGGIGLQTLQEAVVDVRDCMATCQNYAEGQVLPPGPAQIISGQGMSSSREQGRAETAPLSVFSNPLPATGEQPPLRVLHGARSNDPVTPQVTPFGGAEARTFMVQAPFVVHAFYEGTRVDVQLQERSTSTTLSENQALEIGDGGWGTVTASKPISVTPTGQPQHYSRFLAAKPGFIEPQVFTGEYRGYLIDVRSVDGQDPVFFEGLPGETIRVPLLVENLGRWDGKVLQDIVHLEADARTDLSVNIQFDESSLVLNSGQPVRAHMDVHIPADMDVDSQLRIDVRGISQGNENMQADFRAVIFTRQTFGVDMWFGEATSNLGDSFKTESFTPGNATLVPFVVKNIGTGVDTYLLESAGLQGGWEAQILHDGVGVDHIGPLEPQEQVGLNLAVRAPETLEVADIILNVFARSEPPQTAADQIRLHARLSLGRDMAMTLDNPELQALPGETVRFHIDVENTGREGVSLLFELVDTLPSGWVANFVDIGDPDMGPLSIGPNTKVTVPIDVTVPDDAPASLLATALLRATGASAGDQDLSGSAAFNVEVVPVQDLLVSGPDVVEALPGEAIQFALNLTNQGNDNEEVRVFAVLPGGWKADAVPITHLERHGGQQDVAMNITLPDHVRAGPVPMEIFVQADGMEVAHGLVVDVQAHPNIVWQEIPVLHARPGENMETKVLIANQGNTDETLDLEITPPQLWQATAEPARLELPVGQTRVVTIEWHVPWGADGEEEIRVTASSDSTTATLTLDIDIAPPALVLEGIEAPERPPRNGEMSFVTVIVRNPTPSAAEGAQVRLVAGERLIDGVRFDSVGPNGTAVAPLRWIGEGSAHEVNVQWGIEHEGEFVVLGEQTLAEALTETLDDDRFLPAPSLVFALTVVFIFAVFIVRRREGGGRR